MPKDITRFTVATIGPSDVTDDLRSLEASIGKLNDDLAPRNVALQLLHWSKLPPGAGK